MSIMGLSRRGWRPAGAGAAAGSAAGRGTWFVRACVIIEPIAPSPAGQEKPQPSYSQVMAAIVKIKQKSTVVYLLRWSHERRSAKAGRGAGAGPKSRGGGASPREEEDDDDEGERASSALSG